MIRGEHVLNTLSGLERVWNRYGTGMERTPSSTSLFRYCIRWSGTEGSGTEFGDLIRSSVSGSGSGCSLNLFPTCSGPLILSGSHICIDGDYKGILGLPLRIP